MKTSRGTKSFLLLLTLAVTGVVVYAFMSWEDEKRELENEIASENTDIIEVDSFEGFGDEIDTSLPESNKNDDMEAEDHEESEACYREILAEYKAAAESDFSEDFLEQTEYVNMGAYNFRDQDKYSIYYRVEDLNECGNDELIISINEKEAPPNIIDIYGIRNGVPVRITENNTSVGYRSRYYICIDKRIKNTGSGGGLDTQVCYYRLLEDEMSLELDEQYAYNGWNGDEYTLIDGNGNVSSVSRENYESVLSDADVDFESEWKILYEGNSIHYIE